MAFNKITGSQAILGGATILTAPTIYGAPTALTTTASTGVTKIYGVPEIEETTTDSTLGGIKLGGCTQYIRQIALNNAGWASTNYNAEVLIPAGAVVTDAMFDVTTVSSSLTLTFGTTGDPNGFLLGIATDSLGSQSGVLTAGSETYGDLLVDKLCTTIDALGRVNYDVGETAVNVAVGRSATDLDQSVEGNLYITYIVPG